MLAGGLGLRRGASAPAGAASNNATEPTEDSDDGDALRRTASAGAVAGLAGHLPSVLDDDDRAELAHALSSADITDGRAALCRWGGWALGLLIVAASLCWLMDALSFGFLDSGATTLETTSRKSALEFVGWAPGYLQAGVLLFVVKKLCKKVTGFDAGRGLGMALLTGHGDGDADAACWLALVQPADGKPQPTWAEAREERGLTQRQAVSSAVVKLFLWHLSQPLVYLGLLCVYRCFVAKLGGQQPWLASVVGAREVLYIVSLLFATAKLPVFLLLDLRMVWVESAPLERFVRLAMYVLMPHNYVALCSAARFPAWRRAFLGLAATQVIADLSSCFALAALLASTVQEDADATTAGPLKVGFSITAFGFLLFFGPLSVATNLEAAAADLLQHRAIRIGRGIAGASLLFAWGYLMLVIVLLMFNEDVFCPGDKWYSGLTIQGDPCNGHGECYAAAQCRCEPGFGPEVSYSGEPLCARHMVCTAGQLQHAVASHEEAACGGPHFPGPRLLTPEWGAALTCWVGSSVVTDEWTLCYS